MKSSVLKVVASVSLAFGVPVASAAVLDFDDLNGFAFFTAPYKGFVFGDIANNLSAWIYDNKNAPPLNAQSQPTHVGTNFQQATPGNKFEDSQPITNPVDFRFDGAFFSGYDDVQVKFKLSLNGNVVYTSPAPSAFLSATPTFVASGYSGFVDSVVIVSEQGYYAMDDFIYNPIPEPSALALMVAGLGAVGFLARRRKAL
jgi:hypothetical protein